MSFGAAQAQGEVGATAGNRPAALRGSVRDFADSRPEVASSGRLGPQRFRGGVAVDQPVFSGEPTVVQETPFMRYGCGGDGVVVSRPYRIRRPHPPHPRT